MLYEVITSYQGCTEGLCYPPMEQRIALTARQAMLPALPARSGVALDPRLGQALQGGLLPTLGLFLLLGLGLALTPCMFPMYPILSSLILGQGALPWRRALWLSLVFVQGMALTYTLLGLLVASAGLGLQVALQQPLVLIAFSLLYVALALSMFGLYELRLPAGLQGRLVALANRQRGGSTLGVAMMGLLSGLICSPCTTAPLSGALLFVAQSGDRITSYNVCYTKLLRQQIEDSTRVVFVDFKGEQARVSPQQAVNEVTAAGFVVERMDIHACPDHYILQFRKSTELRQGTNLGF